MELKKYKKKRVVPKGWKEITLADVFRTSSGATPLSTEASFYEEGTIPWINSGELSSPYIYSTTNYLKWKRVQTKLFVRFFQIMIIVPHFLNIV